MIGYLRFSTFIFWILPNLAKDTYGRSSLEQHYKIEKIKNNIPIPIQSPILFVLKLYNYISSHEECVVTKPSFRTNPKVYWIWKNVPKLEARGLEIWNTFLIQNQNPKNLPKYFKCRN